jgi:hypothetical protein
VAGVKFILRDLTFLIFHGFRIGERSNPEELEEILPIEILLTDIPPIGKMRGVYLIQPFT